MTILLPAALFMKTKLPFQVKLLTICYALMLCGTSMVVLTAGLIGQTLAPDPKWATLPVALMIVGVAANTIPIAMLMSRFGRKKVFLSYAIFAIASALLAGYSLHISSFNLFCMAAFAIGAAAGSAQQYRFVAMESVAPEMMSRAASTILLGGILAAFLGPELSVFGKDGFQQTFVGSFVLLAAVNAIGFLLLTQVRSDEAATFDHDIKGRPLLQILTQPNILIAIAAAALAYAVMSFLMTATPLSMHHHHGHSLTDTKWVIQAHIAAMYLPSLFSGAWVARFGYYKMMGLGALAFAICLIVAFSSQTMIGFMLALILLGVGWNFLFVAGTALLPTGYSANERFKVQATNDFLVFGTQALAALSSGWLLFQYAWQGILLMSSVPLVLFITLLIYRLRQSSLQSTDTSIPVTENR